MRGLLVLPILFLFSGVSAQNHTADDGTYEASEIDKVEQAIQELKSRCYEFAFKEAFAAYTVFQLIGVNHRAGFALDDLKKAAS
ncbi:hypothetical protein C0J52_25620 [Blattella germanica]|nr:hypothetical protein C0J52_25620 [Blattella germanica]